MGPGELVLCLRRGAGAFLLPWNKHLIKHLPACPLAAGAMLTSPFFNEMLHFFDCLTLSPRYL